MSDQTPKTSTQPFLACDEHGYYRIACPECKREAWLEDHAKDREPPDFSGVIPDDE